MKRLSLEEQLRTYSCFQVRPWPPPIPPAGEEAPAPAAGSGSGSISSTSAAAGEIGEPVAPAPAERRKRTPGRWRRIPRTQPPTPPWERYGHSKTWEELLAENLDLSDEGDYFLTEEQKVLFRETKAQSARLYQRLIDAKNGRPIVLRPLVLSDTPAEHLTAEEMEANLVNKDVGHQARHFAKLAIDHYNNKEENTTKIEICTALLSNCFHEICGSTFGHVNFTAKAKNDDQAKKSLYFAELKLNPDLLGRPDVEPMCVVRVYNLDGFCFGGCHEISRKIDHKMVGNQDYERCHACSDRIKHPSGDMFIAGHDSTKTPYFSAG